MSYEYPAEVLAEVNVPRLRFGIAALRSGLYRKGLRRLHKEMADGTHQWCCLGVLSDIAAKYDPAISRVMHEGLIDNEFRFELFGGDSSYLCPAVSEFFGLPRHPILDPGTSSAILAAGWNDEGRGYGIPPEEDFTAIAEGFERLADAAQEYQEQKET
jgi:hypothetical protein